MMKQVKRKRATCPFCEGDGCCFCDHDGFIYIGEKELIKSEEGLNSIGVRYLKESDAVSQLESWPEMFEHFLDEKNVPADFKTGISAASEAQLPVPEWIQNFNQSTPAP